MGNIKLRPSGIRFTRENIETQFDDGRKLTDTFRDLLHGNITVKDIKSIEVFNMNYAWWALSGNRRLFLYRRLVELGVISEIEVKRVPLPDSTFCPSTTWNGLGVRCLDPEFESRMSGIIGRWKFHNRFIRPLKYFLMVAGVVFCVRHLKSSLANGNNIRRNQYWNDEAPWSLVFQTGLISCIGLVLLEYSSEYIFEYM